MANQQGDLLSKSTFAIGATWPASISITSDILIALQNSDDVLILEEHIRNEIIKDEMMLELLLDVGVVLLAPLLSGTRLHGLLLIGERRTGEIYSINDINIVGILCKQAVLAFANARHYEVLLENNLQLEKSVEQRTSQLADANDALEAERAFLSAAIDILPVPIFIRSIECDIFRNNRVLEEFLKLHNADDLFEVSLLNPVSRATVARQYTPSSLALRGEIISAEELLLVTPDLVETSALVHAGPVFVGGKLVAGVVAFQDISALKAADRAKDEFIAMLSHELRTPLTNIFAWAEVGSRENEITLKSKAFEVIIENAIRQRHLLNDLLDVSRITHKSLSLQLTTVDLRNLVRRGVENVLLPSAEQQISINYITAPEEIMVTVDETRMIQVIDNILANALKFSKTGDIITIQCEKTASEATLYVADTGRGMSAESLLEVFLPFRQFERLSSNNGLGLGLPIVKGIVELHHGTITVASPGIGQGCTVTVTLPLA